MRYIAAITNTAGRGEIERCADTCICKHACIYWLISLQILISLASRIPKIRCGPTGVTKYGQNVG